MKIAILKVVQSTQDPARVSLRDAHSDRSAPAMLTAACFEPGEEVVVILKEDFNNVVRMAREGWGDWKTDLGEVK